MKSPGDPNEDVGCGVVESAMPTVSTDVFGAETYAPIRSHISMILDRQVPGSSEESIEIRGVESANAKSYIGVIVARISLHILS